MAYSFTAASTQAISGTPITDVGGTGTATVHFIANRASSGSVQYGGYSASGSHEGPGINWASDNSMYYFVRNNSSVYAVKANNVTGTYGLTLTYGTATTPRLRLFSNGSELATSSNASATITATPGQVWIGRENSTNVYSTGTFSEVAVWSVTLTADEVASLGKGFKPSRVRPQSLIFYAPLVRQTIEPRGGVALTVTNAPTVADHPRVY